MRKNNFYLFLIFFIFLPFIFFNTTAMAESENMDFSMSVVTPKNQFNSNVTYFDLLVQPSEKQTLEIVVTNYGKQTKKIRVTPTNAITNGKGNIDYNIQDKDYKYDKTLEIPFTSLVSPQQTVEVAPGASETVKFDFQAPKNQFKGIILGGFVADLVEDETDESKDNNVTFVNKFQMIKAVILRSSDKKESFSPVIELNDVKPSLYAYRTAVTANLQNKSPMILKNVKVDAHISKSNSSKILKSESRSDVEFAPNSNFDFPIMWDNDPLSPGKYTLNLTVEVDEQKFPFTSEFEISKEDSYRLNEEAIEVNDKKDYTLWIFLAIILSILVILSSVILFMRHKKKKLEASKKLKKSKKTNTKKKVKQKKSKK